MTHNAFTHTTCITYNIVTHSSLTDATWSNNSCGTLLASGRRGAFTQSRNLCVAGLVVAKVGLRLHCLGQCDAAGVRGGRGHCSWLAGVDRLGLRGAAVAQLTIRYIAHASGFDRGLRTQTHSPHTHT